MREGCATIGVLEWEDRTSLACAAQSTREPASTARRLVIMVWDHSEPSSVTSIFGATPFVLVAALLLLMGGSFIIAGLVALRRARPVRSMMRTLVGLLLLAVGGLVGTIGLGMRGYRALTRRRCAHISVRPVGPRAFRRRFVSPTAPRDVRLSGDASTSTRTSQMEAIVTCWGYTPRTSSTGCELYD